MEFSGIVYKKCFVDGTLIPTVVISCIISMLVSESGPRAPNPASLALTSLSLSRDTDKMSTIVMVASFAALKDVILGTSTVELLT